MDIFEVLKYCNNSGSFFDQNFPSLHVYLVQIRYSQFAGVSIVRESMEHSLRSDLVGLRS